jgi:hypothetical protein|tara:strand:+ start:8400 stop:9020 length:621 start_codon:yes stop_codon:yes gene_type:complete
MKYSAPIDIDYDAATMLSLYEKHIGHYLNDPQAIRDNPAFINAYTSYLINGSDIDWPIDNIVNAFGIDVDTIKVFITKPNKKLFLHRDKVANKEELRQWAINVPILNSKCGYNEWFEDKDNNFGNEQVVHGGVATMPQGLHDNYILAESCVLDRVTLLRTDVMHRARNDTDKLRVVLSIRGNPSISWKEILEKVNEYNSKRNSCSS